MAQDSPMQDEVRRYLERYGKVISQSYRSEWNRTGTCWQIAPCGWTIPRTLFQTVTARECILLEVSHDAPDVDDFLLKETLPLKASRKALLLRLECMAEQASRKYVADLAVADRDFWPSNFEGALENLSEGQRMSIKTELSNTMEALERLRHLVIKRAEIQEIVRLHNNIDSFYDRLVDLSLSRQLRRTNVESTY